MTRKYKLAAFDLDGTLLDSSEGILESVIESAKREGLKELSYEELTEFIGPPLKAAFMEHYNVDDEKGDRLVSIYRELYSGGNMFKAKPYDGIEKVLKTLKENDIVTTVATNKPEIFARKILEHFGLDGYFHNICGTDFAGNLTKADVILMSAERAGISNPQDIIMIGDGNNDAVGAEKAKVDFIGATWGFGFSTEEDVNRFKNVGYVSTPEELLKILVK